MVNYALLIGINYIGTQNQLNGCINDIIQMRQILYDFYNYKWKNIRLLRDNDPRHMPTRANIIKELKNLINNSHKYKQIFIQYSGHGIYILGNELDGHEESIVPLDWKTKGVILDDVIRNIISKTKCQTRLMMDSCYSGTVADLHYKYRLNSSKRASIFETEDEPHIKQDVKCISGCRDSQLSYDIYSNPFGRQMGSFTSTLILTLKENNWYNITHVHMLNTIYNKLNDLGLSAQRPVISSSKPMKQRD